MKKDDEKTQNPSSRRIKQGVVIWVMICLGYIGLLVVPIFELYDTTMASQPQASIAGDAFTRDPSNINWMVVPMFVFVLYLYMDYVEKKRYSQILAALAMVFMDMFNEIYNALFFNATNKYAALWMCSYKNSMYQVLIGWNIEIIFNFFVVGLISTKIFSSDREKTILGLNNRHFWSIFWGIIAVGIEITLNKFDMLLWTYPFWNAKCPWLIFLNGYLPFFEMSALVLDADRKTQIAIVSAMGVMLSVAFVGFITLGII